MDDGPGQTDPLFHAFGKIVEKLAADNSGAGKLFHIPEPFYSLCAAQTESPGAEIQILPDCHIFMVGQSVRHIPHLFADLFRVIYRRNTVVQNISCRWEIQRSHDPYGSGFSGAVGTDKSEDVSGRKRKTYIIQRFRAAENPGQMLDFDLHWHTPSALKKGLFNPS